MKPTLHPYIPHLLADILAAHRSDEARRLEEERELAEPEASFEEYIAEVERWIEHGDDPTQPSLAAHAGLALVEFPPEEQLSDADMEAVIDAVDRMARTYNHDSYYPDDAPAAFRYNLMLEWLAEPTSIPSSGRLCMDYCTGYAPGCRLGPYCRCLEIWNTPDEDFEKDSRPDEPGALPF